MPFSTYGDWNVILKCIVSSNWLTRKENYDRFITRPWMQRLKTGDGWISVSYNYQERICDSGDGSQGVADNRVCYGYITEGTATYK